MNGKYLAINISHELVINAGTLLVFVLVCMLVDTINIVQPRDHHTLPRFGFGQSVVGVGCILGAVFVALSGWNALMLIFEVAFMRDGRAAGRESRDALGPVGRLSGRPVVLGPGKAVQHASLTSSAASVAVSSPAGRC